MAGRRVACRVALAVLVSIALGACDRPRPGRWNLLVVTLDTTRADALGCYGNSRIETPRLDALAAAGTRFDQAMSAAPITLPSHSTIFTGTYPLYHGVRDNGAFALPAASRTLAEVLHEAGYATAAAVGSYPVIASTGLAQGFAVYDDSLPARAEGSSLFFQERSAVEVNQAILPWLRQQRGPFFAWIHYWDAHQPTSPPAPFDQLYAADPYFGEIAFVDRSLGVVLDTLAEQGELDSTLVVVVGDHGEGRGEHREDSHSILLYGSTLRVPLIVRPPQGMRGQVVTRLVGTVDLLPTILDLLGLPIPEGVQGRSLAATIRDGSALPRPPPYYAETLAPRLSFGWGELRALFVDGLKYVHGPRPELYRPADDPHEVHDLLAELPADGARVRGQLESFLSTQAGHDRAAAIAELDDEGRANLEALGYISASGHSPGEIREELHGSGPAPQDRVADNSLISRAKQLLDQHDFAGARHAIEELRSRDPDNAYYTGLLAIAAVSANDNEAALAALAAAPSISRVARDVAVELARRLFERGDEEEALALIERLSREHDSAAVRYLWGEMWAARGDLQQSIVHLREAIALDPRHRSARLNLATRLVSVGFPEEGEPILRALVEEVPLEPRYHYNLAVVLEASDRDAALAEARRAHELDAGYCPAATLRASLGGESELAAAAERSPECFADE